MDGVLVDVTREPPKPTENASAAIVSVANTSLQDAFKIVREVPVEKLGGILKTLILANIRRCASRMCRDTILLEPPTSDSSNSSTAPASRIPKACIFYSALCQTLSLCGRPCSVLYGGVWYDGSISEVKFSVGGKNSILVCFEKKGEARTAEWIDVDTYASTPDGMLVAIHQATVRYQVGVRAVWCQVKGFPWWPGMQQLCSSSENTACGRLKVGLSTNYRNTRHAVNGREVSSLSDKHTPSSSNTTTEVTYQLENGMHSVLSDEVCVLFPTDGSSTDATVKELPALLDWYPADFSLDHPTPADLATPDRLTTFQELVTREVDRVKSISGRIHALASMLSPRESTKSALWRYKVAKSSSEKAFSSSIKADKTASAEHWWSSLSKEITFLSSNYITDALFYAIDVSATDAPEVVGGRGANADIDHLQEDLPPAAAKVDYNAMVGRWIALCSHGSWSNLLSDATHSAKPASVVLLEAERAVLHGDVDTPSAPLPAIPVSTFSAVSYADNASAVVNLCKKLIPFECLNPHVGFPAVGWIAKYCDATQRYLVVFATPNMLGCLGNEVTAETIDVVVSELSVHHTHLCWRTWVDARSEAFVPLPIASPLVVCKLAGETRHCAVCQLPGEHAECQTGATDAVPEVSGGDLAMQEGVRCHGCGSTTPSGLPFSDKMTDEWFSSRLTAVNAVSLKPLSGTLLMDIFDGVKLTPAVHIKALHFAAFRAIRGVVGQGRTKAATVPEPWMFAHRSIAHPIMPARQQQQRDNVATWSTRTYKVIPGMRACQKLLTNFETEPSAALPSLSQHLCKHCSSQYASGCFCPVCQQLYDEFSRDMLCCDACEGWVHVTCDGMTIDDITAIEQKKHPLWSDTYVCPPCRYRSMLKILLALRQEDKFTEFTFPVTEEQAPGYFNIIKTPMDLLTIASNLDRCVYDAPGLKGVILFRSHIELFIRNAIVFNTPQDRVYRNAWRMLQVSDGLFDQSFPRFASSASRLELKNLQDGVVVTDTPTAAETPANEPRDESATDESAARFHQLNTYAAPSASTHDQSADDKAAALQRPSMTWNEINRVTVHQPLNTTFEQCLDCAMKIDSDENEVAFRCKDCGEAWHATCTRSPIVAATFAQTALMLMWTSYSVEKTPEWTHLLKLWDNASLADRTQLFHIANAYIEGAKPKKHAPPADKHAASAQKSVNIYSKQHYTSSASANDAAAVVAVTPPVPPTLTLADVAALLASPSLSCICVALLASDFFRNKLKSLTSNWRCIDCAVCGVCGDNPPDYTHAMLACYRCGQYVHQYCCSPVLVTPPEAAWFCGNCVECRVCRASTPHTAAWSLRADMCRDCHVFTKGQHQQQQQLPPGVEVSPFSMVGLNIPAQFEEYLRVGMNQQDATSSCPVCHTADSADSVCCDSCGRWVHLTCDPRGMGKAAYAVVSEVDAALQYFCSICRQRDPHIALQSAKEWVAHVQRVRLGLRSFRSTKRVYNALLKAVTAACASVSAMTPAPPVKPLDYVQLISRKNSVLFENHMKDSPRRRVSRALGRPSFERGYRSPLTRAGPLANPVHADPKDVIAAAVVRHSVMNDLLSHPRENSLLEQFVTESINEMAAKASTTLKRAIQPPPSGSNEAADTAAKPVTPVARVDTTSIESDAVLKRKLAALCRSLVDYAKEHAIISAPHAATANNTAVEPRCCMFCKQAGDAPINMADLQHKLLAGSVELESVAPHFEGRLMPVATASGTPHMHAMCALWSGEQKVGVGFDGIQGYGQTLVRAAKRAAKTRCALCGGFGASLSCGFIACDAVFHVRCAVVSGGCFSTGTFECSDHRSTAPANLTADMLSKIRFTRSGSGKSMPHPFQALAVVLSDAQQYKHFMTLNPLFCHYSHAIDPPIDLVSHIVNAKESSSSAANAFGNDLQVRAQIAAHGRVQAHSPLNSGQPAPSFDGDAHAVSKLCSERSGDAVCLLRSGGLYLLDAGHTAFPSSDAPPELGRYSIGYHAQRLWWGVDTATGRVTRVVYDLRIIKTRKTPICFLITCPSVPSWHIVANTAENAFMQLRYKLARSLHNPGDAPLSTHERLALRLGTVGETPHNRLRLRWSDSKLLQQPPPISGDAFFGLHDPWVQHVVLQQLAAKQAELAERSVTLARPKEFFASGSARAEGYTGTRSKEMNSLALLACTTTFNEELYELDRLVMGDDVPEIDVETNLTTAAPTPSNAAHTDAALPTASDVQLDGHLQVSEEVNSSDSVLAAAYRSLIHTAFSDRLVVRRSPIHGWGLFLKQVIPQHSIVIEYTGHLVRQPVADRRERVYEEQHRLINGASEPSTIPSNPGNIDAITMFDIPVRQRHSDGSGSCYLFRLDDEWIVDATVRGSAARFMNHSCEPNCYSEIVTIDGKKKIIILALRDLKVGEEVTYNYKFALETDPSLKIPCYCGAPTCPGTMN